nr:hypothetical protein CFP56_20707 [Quercus suber]
MQSNLSEQDVHSDWREWIFKESLRRVCVIYQIANMLVYFEPAAMCEKPLDFFLAPLPARKQLWEAGDALSWRTEVEKGTDAFGLASNGEISYLNEYPANGLLRNRSSIGPWEQWCSGMDGFGGLVMLAATLLV